MSGKLLAIVKREYLERVRTKAFLIGTILGPVLMGVMMILPMFAMRTGNKPLSVAILDVGGSLQAPVEQALRDARFDDKLRFEVRPGGSGPIEAREADLKRAVLAGTLDGYLLVPNDAVLASKATYYGRNVSNRIDLNVMQRSVGEVLTARRLTAAGLDPARVKDLTKELDLRTIRLSEAGEREDRGAAAIFSIILMMILYTSILMWGQAVMTGVIEEKTSRVVEVVASGIAPTRLLAGKLLGVGGAGLTQFLVWALSLLGVSLAAAGPIAGGFRMPEVTPLMLASFLVFFLLGFAFYAGLYAAVGAAVNSVQEAQNFIFPIVIPLVLGLMFFPTILESPDSTLSIVLSLVPFLTPLLMFLRIVVLTPPWWQIALSVVLTAATIAGIVWVAARIYRVGILMYGKRPTFPELVRWVRHP
jgi:ABC-2 type transport system permease protein